MIIPLEKQDVITSRFRSYCSYILLPLSGEQERVYISGGVYPSLLLLLSQAAFLPI
jgi:hypothetical protein